MTPARSPFASTSVPRHLARGAAALLALAAIPFLLRTGGLLGIVGVAAAAVSAFVLLRGCPMCWMVGFVETVTMRASGQAMPVDGTAGERP